MDNSDVDGRTFVEKPEPSRRQWPTAGGRGDGEEDGGLVRRTGEDDVVVDCRAHHRRRVEPVRHPQSARPQHTAQNSR